MAEPSAARCTRHLRCAAVASPCTTSREALRGRPRDRSRPHSSRHSTSSGTNPAWSRLPPRMPAPGPLTRGGRCSLLRRSGQLRGERRSPSACDREANQQPVAERGSRSHGFSVSARGADASVAERAAQSSRRVPRYRQRLTSSRGTRAASNDSASGNSSHDTPHRQD